MTQAKLPPKKANDIDRAVAETVRRARVKSRKSQGEIGNAAGVTFQQMQKYEKGTNRMSVGRFVAIAEALDITPAQLLSRALIGRSPRKAPQRDAA